MEISYDIGIFLNNACLYASMLRRLFAIKIYYHSIDIIACLAE